MSTLEVGRGLVQTAMTRTPVLGRDGKCRPGCLYCGGLGGHHSEDCAAAVWLDDALAADAVGQPQKGPSSRGVYSFNRSKGTVEKIR